MTIYMYLNDNEHDDIVTSIEPCINDWLFQNNIDAQFVNQKVDSAKSSIGEPSLNWKLGLKVQKDQMDWIPQIINFLHSTAMLYKKDYVVAVKDKSEPIGFFGFNHGKNEVDKILGSLSFNS